MSKALEGKGRGSGKPCKVFTTRPSSAGLGPLRNEDEIPAQDQLFPSDLCGEVKKLGSELGNFQLLVVSKPGNLQLLAVI